MKDLLEVIEEGREEFNDKLLEEWLDWDSQVDDEKAVKWLTSHTKAILTNQIERMKGELVDCKPKRESWAHNEYDKMVTYYEGRGNNNALQTQIDYLEEILDKLN